LKLLKLNYQWYWVVVALLTISLLMTPSNAFANEQNATNDWNNPYSYMYFNKGSEFMNKMGFTWNEAQFIRPIEPIVTPTNPSTEPVTAVPAKSVNSPDVAKPSEANLPLTPSEAFTSARIIGYLDNILTTFVKWISTIIQQLSSSLNNEFFSFYTASPSAKISGEERVK